MAQRMRGLSIGITTREHSHRVSTAHFWGPRAAAGRPQRGYPTVRRAASRPTCSRPPVCDGGWGVRDLAAGAGPVHVGGGELG
jgi:hypothetical protein